MVVHDVNVYHCQKCGKVANREHDEQPPVCCGEEMAVAVAHVRYESGDGGPRSTEEVIEKSHESPAKPR